MISTTAATLGHARGVVVVGLVGFAAGSWLYLGVVAARMGDMSSTLAVPMTSAWSPLQAALMATMWVVMMAAMMLPSAVPMVLTYDRLDRVRPRGRVVRSPCSLPVTPSCGRRSPLWPLGFNGSFTR